MEYRRQSASIAEPMRCTQCDRSFKRLEHLRRHERIHDNTKRFACRQCSKLFTRSDILRRHEATHAATTIANSARATSDRACTECAKSKARCTKSNPCQRCLTKGLRCAYPHVQVSVRTQQSQYGSGSGSISHMPLDPSHQTLVNANGVVSNESGLDRQLEPLIGPEPIDAHSMYTSYQQLVHFEMPDYHQNQVLHSTMDFPMNWLPPDNSIAIDYDSIVGLGIGSLDFFSLPQPSTDVPGIHNTVRRESFEARPLSTTRIQIDSTVRRDMHMSSASDQGTPWSNVSPEAVESYVSSDSPRSVAHPISPSDAPGGLYATSINGARMPCTIRARRASRLIPGAKPIRPLTELASCSSSNNQGLSFPDLSHVFIDNASASAGGGMRAVPMLTNSIYEDIQRNFSRLCLNDCVSFPLYASSRFPDISSLNLCVRLYFENFDTVMPILHDQVTRISDHWLLALSVCAIGCQYAEADEYSQMVEPLHEFLRRAITVEFTDEILKRIGQDGHGVAFAQAMTLNQVGMLYSGSPKLLHFAKAQHSALIELARALMFPAIVSEAASADVQDGAGGDSQETTWRKMVFEESKRRIGYSIWLLDCMAAYHFQQQPLMPPDIMLVSLPNDKLWQSRHATDWLTQAVLVQDAPSLSLGTASLFREKQLVKDMGQFSRVILLHGVYREILQLKNCFARPLGNWVPSIQQTAVDNNNNSMSPSISDRSGRSLLNSWRNAALDCVDVLHWAANGTIALQAGAEHPTVLHLHLSRAILLAPFDRFQILADSVVSFAQDSASRALDVASRKQIINAERDILEWAQRDQCKARLAVLHSGCLFWHIRRYSCRAFYEPTAVFLATLTIWAYSSYASRTPGNSHDMSSRSSNIAEEDIAVQLQAGADLRNAETSLSPVPDEQAEPAPTFIHLDRPNDDEMVQAFVRFGTATAMRANITGVGDIYSPKGPARILKEGRKILATVSTAWGRTDRFSSVLEVLEQIASGRMTLESRPP